MFLAKFSTRKEILVVFCTNNLVSCGNIIWCHLALSGLMNMMDPTSGLEYGGLRENWKETRQEKAMPQLRNKQAKSNGACGKGLLISGSKS